MTTTYKRMDVVMVKESLTSQWNLGIVNEDFNEGDHWVRAEAKTSENCTSFMAPGFDPGDVRLATDADIAAAPAYARDWLQQERDREELRLLNERDPMVRTKTRKGVASLRAAGISRISDLARFTDKELLALDGVGKTAVKQWREQAAELQQQEVGQ